MIVGWHWSQLSDASPRRWKYGFHQNRNGDPRNKSEHVHGGLFDLIGS